MMPRRRKGNGAWGWPGRKYSFVDRDPECDVFQATFVKEEILESELAVLAGLHAQTVRNMFAGKTRKPQHATFAKMAGAMGYRYGMSRNAPPNYEKEIPLAKEEYKAYLAALRKKRAAQRKKATKA